MLFHGCFLANSVASLLPCSCLYQPATGSRYTKGNDTEAALFLLGRGVTGLPAGFAFFNFG